MVEVQIIILIHANYKYNFIVTLSTATTEFICGKLCSCNPKSSCFWAVSRRGKFSVGIRMQKLDEIIRILIRMHIYQLRLANVQNCIRRRMFRVSIQMEYVQVSANGYSNINAYCRHSSVWAFVNKLCYVYDTDTGLL